MAKMMTLKMVEMMKLMRVRAQTTQAQRDDVREIALGCVAKNKTQYKRSLEKEIGIEIYSKI